MDWTKVTRALMGAPFVVAAYASTEACSSSGGADSGGEVGGSGGQAGTAGQGGGDAGSSGGSGADAGPICAGGCDDGFNCTVDVCLPGGKCQHSIGPNSGSTACPAGQYCTLPSGCTAAPACATTTDCQAAWKGDACKASIKCDPTSSVCTFKLLDKDGDGFAPQICGGNDCDDNNKAVHPSAVEECNGKDDDCDGVVDDHPASDDRCKSEHLGGPYLTVCKNGSCACDPANLCGTECVNKLVATADCGSCGNVCGVGFLCKAGQCTCPNTVCGGACVDATWDVKNCGSCGNVCTVTGSTCSNGQCTCSPPEGTACGGACVDVSNDAANCGSCGNACATGGYCNNGTCDCQVGMACGGTCVDQFSDPNNCGSCGHVCPTPATACANGNCTCPSGTTCCGGIGATPPSCNECLLASCCAEAAACSQEPACIATLQCFGACSPSDKACLQNCVTTNNSSAYATMVSCTAQKCQTTCH